MQPKEQEENEFSLKSSNIQEKDHQFEKKYNILMRTKSIKLVKLKNKTPDQSVPISRNNSIKSISIIEDIVEPINDKSLENFEFFLDEKSQENFITDPSVNLSESKKEAFLFCKNMFDDINKARANPKRYLTKIEELARHLIFDETNTVLELESNDRNYKINLIDGNSSINRSWNYINKIKVKLNQLELIDDLQINFPLNYKFDQKNENFKIKILSKLNKMAENRGFEVDKINTVYSQWFSEDIHEAELVNLISMIDGEDNLSTVKLNFNPKNTHLCINTLKFGENERITFLLFAKQKN